MIPRRIDREDGSDNYRALALYIADASIGEIQGEKTLHSWYLGGQTEDYLEGMIEVEATQALNMKADGPKTYHLMASFQPEDEAKLTPKVLEEIELILAQALGFDEHQRHCGVHVNTDNMHLHVAYNKIHPEKLTCHTPYYDYHKLARACRMIEQKYGLAIDKGAEPDIPKKEGLASAKIKSIESQTGQETLFSYVLRHKSAIMTEIEQAKDWMSVHEVFLKRGLVLKLSGNGLTIKDRYGKHYAKPSRIDRSLSKGALASRLGDFEEATSHQLHTTQSQDTYSAIPLHQGPERDDLYNIFLEEMRQRKEALEAINQLSNDRYGHIKEQWRNKRETLTSIPMLRHDRQKLMLRLKQREQGELLKMRAEMADKRNKIRAEIPYTSWTKCLQHKAALGDETALAILRSKKELVQPERQNPILLQTPTAKHDKWANKRNEIVEASSLSGKHRQALLSVIKMREILEKDYAGEQPIPNLSHSIDTKGTIIFRISGVGTIRDNGKEINYRAYDSADKTVALAQKYAQAKWGPLLVFEASTIKRAPTGKFGHQQDDNFKR